MTSSCKKESFIVSEDVWEKYATTKDIGLRNQILEAYLYIVTTNIKRMNMMPFSKEDIEDLTNEGILELINCIDRFDPSKGARFDTYASIRVRGSIIDYVRKKDWAPREVRKRIKDLEKAEQEFLTKYKREPEDSELAEVLGISVSAVESIRIDRNRANLLEFEETIYDSKKIIASDENDPEKNILGLELKKHLMKFIDELDEKERTVVSLYYFDELKLKEIAYVMDLTPSRISQIHSKAISKLKKRLTDYINN